MSVDGSAGRVRGRDDDVVVRRGEHGWIVGNENVSDLTSAMVLADLFAADQAVNDADELEAVDGYGTTSYEPRRDPRTGESPSRGPRSPAPAHPSQAGGRGAGGRAQADPSVRNMPSRGATSGERPSRGRAGAGEAERLAVTVSQLEHALASRVRVEQAIGVLAERHRLRPRDAFDLLRRAARSRGRRVTDIAQDVVASASNPLIRLPEELSRKLPEARPRGRSMRRSPRHAQRA